MSDVTNDRIDPVLPKMQGDLSELKFDMRDSKVRMTMVEEYLGSSITGISGVNSCLDRLNDRVDRIENRLDLTEAR